MPLAAGLLTVEDHSRDSASMTYVYPVVSRRAQGVSVGINLNPNNACNWQCVYCQVPGLSHGGPPPIDLVRLKQELDRLLGEIKSGRFMQEHVPPGLRHLQDVAFSGNGEPTSAKEFSAAVEIVVDTLRDHALLYELKLRLITNGSQIGRTAVQGGLRKLAEYHGEVWFKMDSVTAAGIAKINGVRVLPEAHLQRLVRCAGLCPTWVQSCFFLRDGKEPSSSELDAYVEAMGRLCGIVAGIHLYGLARPSMQPEAMRLGKLPERWFIALAERLRSQGLTVVVSP